jgi:hypothetical protein
VVLVVFPLFCEGCVVCGANLASRVMMWCCCATLCVVAVFCTLIGETVICTLGGASFPTFSAGGITTLDLCDRVAPSKISAKRFNATVCSSPALQNGPAGCGCNSAWVSSAAAFVASSCVEGSGNFNFSRKKSTVSTTRSPLVLLMYTV